MSVCHRSPAPVIFRSGQLDAKTSVVVLRCHLQVWQLRQCLRCCSATRPVFESSLQFCMPRKSRPFERVFSFILELARHCARCHRASEVSALRHDQPGSACQFCSGGCCMQTTSGCNATHRRFSEQPNEIQRWRTAAFVTATRTQRSQL